MKKPVSRCPFIVSSVATSTNFGKVDDISKLESIIKAHEIDVEKHRIEWLKYALYLSERRLKKLVKKAQ